MFWNGELRNINFTKEQKLRIIFIIIYEFLYQNSQNMISFLKKRLKNILDLVVDFPKEIKNQEKFQKN